MDMMSSSCPRCNDSAVDPEDSFSGSTHGDYPEPPALEPCRDCQFPKQCPDARLGIRCWLTEGHIWIHQYEQSFMWFDPSKGERQCPSRYLGELCVRPEGHQTAHAGNGLMWEDDDTA